MPGQRAGFALTYNSANHLGVLFQMWGSVWPKVLPYCLVNVAIAASIQAFYVFLGIDLTISGQSHSFMNMLVAFLLVTRVNIAVSRYMNICGVVGSMYQETRELLQTMTIFTRKMQETGDKEWRNETAYRALVLLRSVMAVIDYRSDGVPAWEISELDPKEAASIKEEIYFDFGIPTNENMVERTEFEETMRVPTILVYKLRCCLESKDDLLSGKIDAFHSLRLYDSVDSFMSAYHGLLKCLTTPFPFPLVQMSRTFLFFYIFTVPFALMGDVSSLFVHLVVIFFLTYGFVGLEMASIELDDPFGDDANDIDNLAMARVVFEDAYLLIMNVDGREWADKLRAKLNKVTTSIPTEQSPLLGNAYAAA